MTALTPERISFWGHLTVRLIVAQILVLLAGLVIVLLTAVLARPSMFYDELIDAGHAAEATELGLEHLQEALRPVSLIAVGVGAVPALCIAGLLCPMTLILSWNESLQQTRHATKGAS